MIRNVTPGRDADPFHGQEALVFVARREMPWDRAIYSSLTNHFTIISTGDAYPLHMCMWQEINDDAVLS